MTRYPVRDIAYDGDKSLPFRDGSEQRRKVQITGFKPYNSTNNGVSEMGLLLTLASNKKDVSRAALIGDGVDGFLADMCVDSPTQTIGRKIRAYFTERVGKYFVTSVSISKQKVADRS